MITNTQRRHDLVGTGGVGPFSYQFMILADTDLQVYVDGDLKTLDTHYTVSGAGNETGGSFTFTSGNAPALNADMIVLGAESETQDHDFQAAANLPASSLEEGLDKIIRLIQQLTERVNRAPVLPVGDSGGFSALTLPAPGDGQYLRWSGQQLALGTPTLVPDDVPAGGGNYDHLVVDSGGTVAWAQELYHYAAGFKNIAYYGNDLAAAVASIGGSTKVCLLISGVVSVTGNVTVTNNITFFFVGAGSLSISSGVTVTYQAGGFLVDDIRRQRFSGSGTFDGSNLSEVIPDQWGADSTGTNDSLAAVEKAAKSLQSTGGKVKFLSGTYDLSDTWTPDRPLIIEGQGEGVTILNMTASDTLQHGIDSTYSLICRDFTIQVETPLTVNEEMHAIRLDLDSTGISDGRTMHIERVTATGWNVAFYCDGGALYGIARAAYLGNHVTASGPAADYIGSCMYMNRVTNGQIAHNIIDQNDVGEHAVYCFGCIDITVEQNHIRNATRNESQAVKLVGQGDGSSSTVYGNWTVRGNDIEDCFNGVLIQTYDTETLGTVVIEQLRAKDITGSTNIYGVVEISVTGNSSIRTVRIQTVDLYTAGYIGVYFDIAAGATIYQATIQGLNAYNWGTSAADTYGLVGATTAGTLKLLEIRDVQADGNNNGKTIWSPNTLGGFGSCVKRLKVDNLVEVNCPTIGYPPVLPNADTTPSVAFGNVFIINNTGATSITTFDDGVDGELYEFHPANSNTTITASSSMLLAGAANFTSTSDDVIALRRRGGKYYQAYKSVN